MPCYLDQVIARLYYTWSHITNSWKNIRWNVNTGILKFPFTRAVQYIPQDMHMGLWWFCFVSVDSSSRWIM